MDDDKFYKKYGMSREEFKIRNILALVIAGIYIIFIVWEINRPNNSQTMLVPLVTVAVMILIFSITKRKR